MALVLGGVETQAALVYTGFPAPGGTSFNSSGTGPGDGVRTWSYSGFDNSAFSELYWGLAPSTTIFSRLSGSGAGSTMTFAGISGNVATWSGTGYYLNNLLQPQTTPTLFRATVNSAATPWVLASSVGLPAALGAVIDNSTGLNYSLNLEFLAWNGSWIPLNTFGTAYDHGSASPRTITSIGGGYYSAEPILVPVPEPSTYLAGALLLLPFAATTVRKLRKNRAA